MTHDLIVIGAGPAGMAAATMGATLGLKTVLLDEQPEPGGQIYRNVSAVHPAVAKLLGPDYLHGTTLVEAMRVAGVDARHDAERHQGVRCESAKHVPRGERPAPA